MGFSLKMAGVPRKKRDEQVEEIAETLKLDQLMHRFPKELSGGQRQRVAIGRAIVRRPKVFLFDEPLSNLDAALRVEMRVELSRLHKRLGTTMIYVTHDQTEALTFADKVVVMFDGRVVQMGTPQQLFEQPEHTFVGYFIGSPGMNVLTAQVDGDKAMLEGTQISLGKGYGSLDGKVELGVRPEFTSLSAGDEGLPVTIKRVEDVGRHKIVRADFHGTEINVLAAEGAEISPDMNRVVFDPAGINVYSDSWRVAPKAA
jgi:glycerol transport system ATP-binding protein